MRLLTSILLLFPLWMQAETKNIGTRDGVVTSPNRTLTFPMQVRFSNLVATNLATGGYAFPSALGIPGQSLTVAPDGLSLIFRATDGSGDMLISVYGSGVPGVVADSAKLGGVLATNYATRAWVVDQIASIEPVDLSDYVTDQDLADAISGIDLSGFALEGHTHDADDIVSGKLHLAQIPDEVATTNYVVDAIAAIPPLDLSGYATTNMVAEAVAAMHAAVTLGTNSLGTLVGQEFTLLASDITAVTDLLYAQIGHDHAFSEITGSVATNQLPAEVVLAEELEEAIANIPVAEPLEAGDHIVITNLVVSVNTNSLDVAGMATDAEVAAATSGGASAFAFHAGRWVGPKSSELVTWSIKSFANPGYVYGLGTGFAGLPAQSVGTMESQFTIPAGVANWAEEDAVSFKIIGESTSSVAVKYQLSILRAGTGDVVYTSGPNQVVLSVDEATPISLGGDDIIGSPTPGETYIVRIEASVTTSSFYVFGVPLIQVVP